MKVVLLVCYFATWAFIPHLLMLKKRPTATLAWLWAILFIPFLGALAYFAIGNNRMKRRRLKRRKLIRAGDARWHLRAAQSDPATMAVLGKLTPEDRQALHLVSCLNQMPVSSAAELRVLCDAEEYYAALHTRIRDARHHIHLEFYVWEPDATGARFLAALTEAARRGVTVRLLLDGFGSRGVTEEMLAEYRDAGGRFSWFQSLAPTRNRFFLNLRNHRKLQVIDGDVAFVGGMNIGQEYEGRRAGTGRWHDVQIEAVGAVAGDLQEVFVDDWFFATGEKIAGPGYFFVREGRPKFPVHIVLGGPDREDEPISKSTVSLINLATRRLWIATGYFVPDDVLLTALELAASRGVDVRVLVSEKNDHPWLVKVGRSYYEPLLHAGVRVFEYAAGIHHAKIALADERWMMVGSANLDYRSMRLNFELNLLVHSAEQNAALARIFETDFAASQEVIPAAFARRPWRQQLAEAALRPLAPLL